MAEGKHKCSSSRDSKPASRRTSDTDTTSHSLITHNKIDKATRHVIAPYAQIERKGLKPDDSREVSGFLDINRFTVFLADSVDLDTLLYETAMVLKTVTKSCGVFVYIVNKMKNEIVLMPHHTKNPKRHEVNLPIEKGKVVAAHVAATKEYLVLDDVERDRRFSEGLQWVNAKTALCMPVVKPNGDCYAVLELFKTHAEPYDSNTLYTVLSLSCWAGAAVHQAQVRVSMQKTAHLNAELRTLLQKYFCYLAPIDTMITDMLAVIKSFVGAMRSSFYIIDRTSQQTDSNSLVADMWDDGWSTEKISMSKKRTKVNLSGERTPAGLVAHTGQAMNIKDAYKDVRFLKEIEPTTGVVTRSCLAAPIKDKKGVIGVVTVTNKLNGQPFDEDDFQIFEVFVSYCSLIVHFYRMQLKKTYYYNMTQIYCELMHIHLRPCKHATDELKETNALVLVPVNFKSYDYHISEGNKDDMLGLVCYMYFDSFAEGRFDRIAMGEFILSILKCYRPNPYHNAEHAFTFTHTMYLILSGNKNNLTFNEIAGLMLAGLCHDLDHPGYNNNYLTLVGHPLAGMYKSSMLEYHHFFLTMKIIEDHDLLKNLPKIDQHRIMEEIKYDILCTDLAQYFQLRAQLAPLITERSFNWNDAKHRRMLKGIMMTSCDLSGVCKPFGITKAVTESVYEEFYAQGSKERAMGFTPLSMMDRRRSINQPAEQIQFLSVVVLPCVLLLAAVIPHTQPLVDNCRKSQEAWHEEIEIRGQRLWRQDDSIHPRMSLGSGGGGGASTGGGGSIGGGGGGHRKASVSMQATQSRSDDSVSGH